MTSVTKDMFSHFRISQQFFRAETEDSLVDIAEVDRDCEGNRYGCYHMFCIYVLALESMVF